MLCDAGDVVIVPFPFVDVTAEKRRPSVILSRRTFNEAHGHSVCAMITTAARSHWPSDIPIANTSAAGLPRACVVRWKVFTLPNAIILRRADALARDDYDGVVAAARGILLSS